MPVRDVKDMSHGTFALAPGTHKRGVMHDPNHPTYKIPDGAIAPEEWRSAAYRVGDVVIFRDDTAHAALPNLSNEIRLSLDIRVGSSLAAQPVAGTVERVYDSPQRTRRRGGHRIRHRFRHLHPARGREYVAVLGEASHQVGVGGALPSVADPARAEIRLPGHRAVVAGSAPARREDDPVADLQFRTGHIGVLARAEGRHPPDHFVARDDREVHLTDAPGAECAVPDMKVSAAHGRRLDLHQKAAMLQFRHGQLEWWSNASGNYKPDPHHAMQAGLPLENFYTHEQVRSGVQQLKTLKSLSNRRDG